MEGDSFSDGRTICVEIWFSIGSYMECRQIQTYNEIRTTDHPQGDN